MENPTSNETEAQEYVRPTFWESNRFVFKGFFIALLILLMLIPSFFVQDLVRERAGRKEQVIAEISEKWGNTQMVFGPFLVIPYLKTVAVADNKTKEVKSLIYYLPDNLSITGNVQPEDRHRSIYDVTLYKAALQIAGHFNSNTLANTGIAPQKILWNEAYLQLGLSDIKGLEKQISIDWDKSTQGNFDVINYAWTSHDVVAKTTGEAAVDMVPGSSDHSELSFPLVYDPGKSHDFTIELHAKGSGGLYFTPTGNQTEVALHSSWRSPAFDGNYLPANSPTNANGFTANWSIPKASRPYSQISVETAPHLDASIFGVKLLQPNDNYAKNERSVKYALLFVTLTFAIFFLMEILQKKTIHPLQYILVGLALILFYVLLLSISEYAGFNKAYVVAAFGIVGLLSFYVGAILHSRWTGIRFGLGLSGLYAYIFFLIQLEDYALLFGSIGLFVVLALIMYYTRKINWYGNKVTKNAL
ncbi:MULTISPECIES: cell envelope integrity protein CreD [Chitinophagaceae]